MLFSIIVDMKSWNLVVHENKLYLVLISIVVLVFFGIIIVLAAGYDGGNGAIPTPNPNSSFSNLKGGSQQAQPNVAPYQFGPSEEEISTPDPTPSPTPGFTPTPTT